MLTYGESSRGGHRLIAISEHSMDGFDIFSVFNCYSQSDLHFLVHCISVFSMGILKS